MLTLIVRDLAHRRWRLVLVTVLIAVVVALLFLMNGMIGQFNHEPVAATNRVGESDYVVAANSSGPFTTPQALPPGLVESIDGATPFLMGRATLEDVPVMLVGQPVGAIVPDGVAAGELPTRPGQLLLDRSAGFEVGDSVVLAGRRVSVVGLIDDSTIFAGLPLAFAPLETAQLTLLGGQDIVSGALLPQAADAELALPPTVRRMTSAEVAADVREPLDAAVDSISIVRLLLWLATGVLIATMVFVTATSRTRDIAVLKAIGARDSTLAGSLLLEALLIAVIAAGLGALLQFVARPLFPLTIRIPGATWWQIPLIAAVIGLVAATLGVRKALNTSPAEAFG